ncbi:MAG: Holo-(acyl-carrier-protein) synthase [Syntrophus sp. PtaB.Bin001]|jgi:holo-[acyl-carrier protein] synthase|nr:MAG: Holo-(acyl-carrier-protein) synthase [Syntrophus sp. PtaB.Bin001]
MIFGTGIDLVEIDRIEKIIQKWNIRFLNMVYSPYEICYCSNKAFPAIHYAARFAAKESFLKSLGMGLGMGIRLKDIEVKNNEHGKPILHLNGRARTILDDHGITSVHLSLSHTSKQAGAVVILESSHSN